MSVVENKAIVQRLVDEGWNGRKLEAFDALLAPDLANRDPNNPVNSSRDTLKQFVQGIWIGFPDFNVRITDAIAEGDEVAKCWLARGTHQGPFLGIPATGKQVEFAGISVYRMQNARIVSISWSYDMLGLLQQLGVVPAMAPAPA